MQEEINWNNCFSSLRFGEDVVRTDERSVYERDYDRIIFSSAFRRLQNKTQVFPLPERVFVHNRLTHSLEVVSVGRSLGMMVGERLAESPEIMDKPRSVQFYQDQLKSVISAACLAHDLGNPAFGHSGEEAISKYFLDRQNDEVFRSAFSLGEWEDLTHFEGNANALRILTKQFNGRLKGGYQITYTTLASILKYPCESLARDKKKGKHRSKFGFFQSDEEVFSKVVKEFGMLADSDKPKAFFRHPFVYLVEAADDICYSIIDYEDAHRLGILSFSEVRDDLMALIEADGKSDMSRLRQNLEVLRDDKNESVAYLRAKAITALVNRCADSFIENRSAIIAGEFKTGLVDSLADLRPALAIIEKKSIGKIYNHESVVKIELAGFKIMSGLIEDLVEAVLIGEDQMQKRHQKILSLIPSQYKYPSGASPYEKIMTVLDYVSGMTDNYALELYRNLRGISVPAV
jgi:dGTPase